MTAPTTCPSCLKWEEDFRSGAYHADCDDCKARALAGSPAAWRAMSAITTVDLQDAIVRVFTQERYAVGRPLVWQWIQKLKDAKAR